MLKHKMQSKYIIFWVSEKTMNEMSKRIPSCLYEFGDLSKLYYCNASNDVW